MAALPPPIALPGPSGPIPALALGDWASARATVILRYGLGGAMAVQWPEAERLAAAGYAVLIPEAPHHGIRDDGFLDRMGYASASEARSLFLDVVEQAAEETHALLEHLGRSGPARFVVAGISMGGFAALAAPRLGPPVKAVIAFLASPQWDDRTGSPHLDLDVWQHCDLFAVVASDDPLVPPDDMRAFTRRLRSRFNSQPRFRELACRGGHTMDPADWNEAWSQVLHWLDARLG